MAIILTGLIYQLFHTHQSELGDIDEYNKHWIDTCQAIDSFHLNWEIPDGLKQIWYMDNLDNTAFMNWKTTMNIGYAIAGIGSGKPISLTEMMSLARDHWAALPASIKRSASSRRTFHTDHDNEERGMYHSGSFKKPRLSEDRWGRKPQKPANYVGPFQKVCSVHGWFRGEANHDDKTCRRIIFLKNQERL